MNKAARNYGKSINKTKPKPKKTDICGGISSTNAASNTMIVKKCDQDTNTMEVIMADKSTGKTKIDHGIETTSIYTKDASTNMDKSNQCVNTNSIEIMDNCAGEDVIENIVYTASLNNVHILNNLHNDTDSNIEVHKEDEIEQLKCLLEDKDIGCEISISIVDIMNKFNSMDKHKKNENMTKLDIMLDIFNERYNKVPKNLNTLAFLADDDKIMLYDHIIPHIDKFDFGLILEYIYDG